MPDIIKVKVEVELNMILILLASMVWIGWCQEMLKKFWIGTVSASCQVYHIGVQPWKFVGSTISTVLENAKYNPTPNFPCGKNDAFLILAGRIVEAQLESIVRSLVYGERLFFAYVRDMCL